MFTKVKAESRKCGDQKLYVAVTRNINPYYFKLMVSCIRVGKQDTILGNSWLSPTNPGECHVPVRTRDWYKDKYRIQKTAGMSQRSTTCACHQNITENNRGETKKWNPQIATSVQTYACPWCQSNTQIKPRSVQTAQIELNPQTATVVERYAWPWPTLHTIQVRLRVGDVFGFNVFIW